MGRSKRRRSATGGRARPRLAAPRLSPDGQKVAVNVRGGAQSTFDVRVYDVLRGSPTRLTFGGQKQTATWSPDGKRLVYGSNTIGVLNLYAAITGVGVILGTAASTGLQQVSAAGGPTTVLTRADVEQGEADHARPEWLPGYGQHVSIIREEARQVTVLSGCTCARASA
jgi:dipeptidyl aminopeptidase/acylaminoacyl peptidase